MDIKLGKNDKKYIEGTDDVYAIMQRVLQRENKIDQEKEHFWIIGTNEVGFILYIELIALGTVRSVPIEPMNVYRVAVMKNATRVIAVHNHPSKSLIPSDSDKDITDRLIQVGKILNIALLDHLIITPQTYVSFRGLNLMQDLEESLKYVPTYQVIAQIRHEEKALAKLALEIEKSKTKHAMEQAAISKERAKAEREAKQIEKQRREKLELTMIQTLLTKDVSLDAIANIMDITVKQVEKILTKSHQ